MKSIHIQNLQNLIAAAFIGALGTEEQMRLGLPQGYERHGLTEEIEKCLTVPSVINYTVWCNLLLGGIDMLSLRSKIAQEVLGYLFLHQGASLYVNEMCRRFGLDRGNLVKKLKELEKEGILTSEWKGNQRYYSLNDSFPLIKEYKKIILKTVGLEESLKKAIGEVKGVKIAVLFGSYAEDKMDLSSDIDLLVVGDHDTLELQKKVSQFQKSIDREINVISMGTKEYERKQKADALLRSIRQKKSIPLL